MENKVQHRAHEIDMKETVEKVYHLEDTLRSFKAEMDMKMKIMEQILATRNEQVTVQKKLLEREQTLYISLLGHWKDSPILAATGHSLNFTNLNESSRTSQLAEEHGTGNQDENFLPGTEDGNTSSNRTSRRKRLRRSKRNLNTATSYDDNSTSDIDFDENNEASYDATERDDVANEPDNSNAMDMGVRVKVEQPSENENENYDEEGSDSEASGMENDEPNSTQPTRPSGISGGRGKGREWIEMKRFENKESALDKIRQEKRWWKRSSYETEEGEKTLFECRYSRHCEAKLYLLCHSRSERCTLYGTGKAHTHSEKTVGLCQEVRTKIDELYKDEITKPKMILRYIREAGLMEPRKNQLSNYLFGLRRRLHEEAARSRGEEVVLEYEDVSVSAENDDFDSQEQGGEHEHGEDNDPNARKKSRIQSEYKKVATFVTSEEAFAHVLSLRAWRQKTKSETSEGLKVYYNCKDLGTKCPCRIYLFFETGKTEVTLYQTPVPHNHGAKPRTGLPEEVRAKIIGYFKEGIIRNTDILIQLRQDGVEVELFRRQVLTWASMYRRKHGLDSRKKSDKKNSHDIHELSIVGVGSGTFQPSSSSASSAIVPPREDVPLSAPSTSSFNPFQFEHVMLPHQAPYLFHGTSHPF